MIKSVLLIFDPTNTWDKIAVGQQNVVRIFSSFVLPLMLVALAAEGLLLAQFGVDRGTFVERVVKVSPSLVVRYEVVQLILGLLILFMGAWLFQRIGEGFHRRHTYTEAFAPLAYSLSPYFLLRILDGWPALNTWICWSISMVLCISALYRGIPRLMKPDPSNALGLYLLCSLLLIIMCGMAHFVAVMVLEEKILVQGWGG